jgi:hypothetical protein
MTVEEGRGGGVGGAHGGCLSIVNTQVVLDSLIDSAGATEHAWGGSTHHDVVLSHLASVEHGVECGNLQIQ